MKIYSIALGIATLFVPPIALADEAINSEALAQVDSLLAKCAAADEKSAVNLKQFHDGMMADTMPAELGKARGVEIYNHARRAADLELDKSDRQQILALCKMISDSQKVAP